MDFEQALRRIIAKDGRYSRLAYLFAFQGLEFTMKKHLKLPENERRHVSASELLDGMRSCALEQFGFMARQVWESWGIRATDDWGNVIYNLIGEELMKQAAEDSVEDFRGVFDFREAFDRQWKFS